MRYTKLLLMMITLSILLLGCASNVKKLTENNIRNMYHVAHQELQVGNWKKAIKNLEIISNNYPFNPYFDQVQLDLIYAYYKNNDLQSAQNITDQFIKLNPNYYKIDYVIYMHGIINMKIDNHLSHGLFRISRYDCDVKYATIAINDLSKIVFNYPNSQYFNDSMRRISILNNRMARYEYSIANYYFNLGAWIAVINRIKCMLRDYPNTEATHDGLKLMEKAYRQIKMNVQANKISELY